MQLELDLYGSCSKSRIQYHLLTPDEAAAHFGCDRQHLYYMIRSGALIAFKFLRKWRILPAW